MVVASNCDSSLHRLSTRALRLLSNMLPTMVIPPRIHWPEPPSSGMENCAMMPPPELTAYSMATTASVDNPYRAAMLLTDCSASGVSAAVMGHIFFR